MVSVAKLPSVRVTPETKAALEASLRQGETLAQLIESAARREAEFRAEQSAAIERAEAALRLAERGIGLVQAEEFLAGMDQRAQQAQARIQGLLADRPPPAER